MDRTGPRNLPRGRSLTSGAMGRLRKTERDMLNPFSNSLWETENLNCDQCSVDGGLWKVTESVAHKPMLVRRLSVLHTIEQKQRPSI